MASKSSHRLLRAQTEIAKLRAARQSFQNRIHRGELIEYARAEAIIIAFAHRWRDQLLTTPARHAAVIASYYGFELGIFYALLDEILRTELTRIAAESRARDRQAQAPAS